MVTLNHISTVYTKSEFTCLAGIIVSFLAGLCDFLISLFDVNYLVRPGDNYDGRLS
jgi:hypothetical protein